MTSDAHYKVLDKDIKLYCDYYLTFKNSTGKSFPLLLSEIVQMVRVIIENYDQIVNELLSHELYAGDESPWVYHEKPYRSLRKYFPDEAFPTINPLIGSQTGSLFRTINIFLCHVLGRNPDSIELSFDKETLQLFIEKLAENKNLLTYKTDLYNNNFKIIDTSKTLNNIVYNALRYCYQNHHSNIMKFLEFAGDKIYLQEKRPYYWTTSAGINGGNDDRVFSDPFSFKEQDYYLSDQWTWDHPKGRKVQDLNETILNDNGLEICKTNDGNFCLIKKNISNSTPLPKPFLLLAGISGTGKTRFVREQAMAAAESAGTEAGVNHCCVSVRPDWHEPSDLLGYVSRIGKSAEYVPTQFLQFLVKAWKYAIDDTGELKPFRDQIPFWLCLDEMNLAPVEQYFADFLSVLESRKWENGVYSCDPLLDSVLITDAVDEIEKLKKTLQLDDGSEASEKLWERFTTSGIAIPPNLIVAGTVNMDETTHGFSRKVIDRALTLDFGEFFPNRFDDYFTPKAQPKQFSPFYESQIDADNRALLGAAPADPEGEKTISFLQKLNELLRYTPFELAYRALNEILLSLVCFKPGDEAELLAVWDDFLMMKILPRIDGDSDKLSPVQNGIKVLNEKTEQKFEVTQDDLNLLLQIYELLSSELEPVWGEDKSRPDLFRADVADSSKPVMIPCRSEKKIAWMIKRLQINGFTSFWP